MKTIFAVYTVVLPAALSAAVFFTPCAAAMAPDARPAHINGRYGNLPLGFEHDPDASPAEFFARSTGYGVLLTPGGVLLDLRAARTPEVTVYMRLLSAQTNARAVALDELPGKSNYLIGRDAKHWRTGITHYARIKYAGVYAGIDVVYYGRQRQLEYDFVVAPGADPRVIQMRFDGVDDLTLTAQGDLVLRTAHGDVTQHKPVIYQQINGARTIVEGGYLIINDAQQVGFWVARYDDTRPLIIDPVLSYATYLGGSGHDAGYSIAVDARGNAYITGATQSVNFPTTLGAHDRRCGADGACSPNISGSPPTCSLPNSTPPARRWSIPRIWAAAATTPATPSPSTTAATLTSPARPTPPTFPPAPAHTTEHAAPTACATAHRATRSP